VLSPTDIAISLAGLDRAPGSPWAAGPRAAIEWATSLRFAHIVLDATAVGVRPRELDRSARRDLAALFRRVGVGFAGLDAWIPSSHFSDAMHAERALDALDAAITLCADLSDLSGASGRVVSIALPESLSAAAAQRIASHAERAGIRIADHALPRAATSVQHAPIIGLGVDPASVLSAAQDPVAFVAALREPPACARLSDLSAAGRVVPGSRGGRLALDAYIAALHVIGCRSPLVADVRHLTDQVDGAERFIALARTGP